MEPENDVFARLEQRIQQAAELVARLREEKEAALAERDAALREAADARALAVRLSQELELLRAQRNEVRNRVEKLIAQIDSLEGG
ncbi:MAG: cell division protein ZapB [Bryobacteraceae bacterium]